MNKRETNSFIRLLDFIASGFYSGYAPFASGTFGTLTVAILIYLSTIFFGPLSRPLLISLALISYVLGVACCKILLKRDAYDDKDDPSQIVIDEFAGYFTTLAFVDTSLTGLIVAFFFFRLFDVLKPPPVRQADSIPGAWGIMTDDILAGIYAGICSAYLLLLIPPTTAYAQSALATEEFRLNTGSISKGRLAFSYEKGEQSDIYIIDFSEQKVLPIAVGKGKKTKPVWSPNAEKIAFVEDGSKVIVFDIHSKNKTVYGANEGLNFPTWSPDGNKIASSSKSSIYIVDILSGALSKLVTPKSGKKFSYPSWSPRGDEIIYVTDEFWPGSDLELYNFAEKKVNSLSTGYQDFFQPSWHPSGGSFIACYGVKENVDIWEFPKGAEFPEVLFQREGQDLDGIWSEDGELLFFAGETPLHSNKFQIFVWVKSLGKIYQITNAKGSIRNLSWTPLEESTND